MKSRIFFLLFALLIAPKTFASQSQEYESKRTPLLFISEKDTEDDQLKTLKGRLYRESTLGEPEALTLKEVLLNPTGYDSYTYHKGLVTCKITSIRGPAPECLESDKAPSFTNFSVPLVKMTKIPQSYDWTVRYNAEDGTQHFFTLRLEDNVMNKK